MRRARAVAAAHPSVKDVSNLIFKEDGAQLEVTIEVPLPNAWKAEGHSPNGVRRFEPSRLDFPATFPLDPPEVSLREDFGRDLAHVQPWTTQDGRPVPCIQDGRLSEFFLQEGVGGILNQTVAWLDHAAEGMLIDPAQGWEPTRRDSIRDFVVADAAALRALVDRQGGHRFFKYEYIRLVDAGKTRELYGQILSEQVTLSVEAAQLSFKDGPFNDDGTLRFGKSLALVVWPGKQPSGKEITCDVYTPETVTDLASLKARARVFGCSKELDDALTLLTRRAKKFKMAGPFSLAIVLCARRPFALIDSDSAIELCIYSIDFYLDAAFPQGDETPVGLAGHRERIAPSLLSKMANVSGTQERQMWSLVGAGSLGSKVALHLARAGLAPCSIVDRGNMSPHNFARHALVPRSNNMQILSMDAKARLLRDTIAGFAQDAIAIPRDVANVLASRSLAKQAWPKGTWAILNTTASLRARSALAASNCVPARVIESLLYSEGRLGLISTEGPERNPNCHDLLAEFYAICQGDSTMRDLLWGGRGSETQRVMTGEGCGSVTMRMSDGRLSLYGSAVAEYLRALQARGFPESGSLHIGKTSECDLGVTWDKVAVPPVAIVDTENGREWSVRIHGRAQEKIRNEVARWPKVETGGVLVGRQEEVTRTFHVVDVIDSPPDSKRSPSEFVLGTDGLRKQLSVYAESTNWTLICLGTWHSHLSPSGPSNTDRQAAHAVAVARLTPSVLLIHTPKGFRALVADGANVGD